MSSLFDFDAPPDRYAVMGNPIAHSKSPFIHAEFARQTGQRMVYTAIQVDEGGFPQAAGNFQASGGKGLNITVPFKREAWAWVDERSARAKRAGAVNTIVFRDGTSYGENTDGAGLVRDLTVNHAIAITGRRVLLIGAGGAVRGVLAPLIETRPQSLVIANRTTDKAVVLARECSDGIAVEGCGLDELEGRTFDIVINGTSASLHGELLPLPESIVAPNGWCYDMMYAAERTPFLLWAERSGAVGGADGLGMLVEQAAESFAIWRGVRPDTAPVIDKLRRAMGNPSPES